MICSHCNNGFLTPTLAPEPLVIIYRGFSKTIGAQLVSECTSCSYSTTEASGSVDIDSELVKFKREINMKMSEGELI